MSKSFRDQRGRPHSGKKCPEAQSPLGCVYCRTGEYKRTDRRKNRHDARRAVRAERER